MFTRQRYLADFLSIDVLLKGSHDLSFDDTVFIMNLSTPLFVEPRDLTINIFQFDFVLFALNLLLFFHLLLKMVKQIHIYIYVYMYAYV